MWSIWKSYVVNAYVDHFPICPAMTPNMSHSLSFLLLLSMWYELIVNIFDFSYVPCPGLHGKQKKGWIANFLLLFWDSFLDLYTFLFLYLAKVYKFINIIVFTFVAKYCLSTLVLARYFHIMCMQILTVIMIFNHIWAKKFMLLIIPYDLNLLAWICCLHGQPKTGSEALFYCPIPAPPCHRWVEITVTQHFSNIGQRITIESMMVSIGMLISWLEFWCFLLYLFVRY